MPFFQWIETKIKKMRWFDISLIKLSSAAFGLMIAKLWPPILALDWYYYLIITFVLAARPSIKMFTK